MLHSFISDISPQSYNKTCFSLSINKEVEVIDLISSDKKFHKVLPLNFIDLWSTQLANKSMCSLVLVRVL